MILEKGQADFDPITLPSLVPGEQYELTVNFTVENNEGKHKNTWRLQTATGKRFGPPLAVKYVVLAPMHDMSPDMQANLSALVGMGFDPEDARA